MVNRGWSATRLATRRSVSSSRLGLVDDEEVAVVRESGGDMRDLALGFLGWVLGKEGRR